jgi:phosphohistidine phosphatase SixA
MFLSKFRSFCCIFSILFLFSCENEVIVTAITKDGNVQFSDGTSRPIPLYNDSTAIILYLVRHAEKEKTGDDPSLTAVGKTRAERLATIFKNAYLSRVITSNKKRTRETVDPIRKMLDPAIETMPADVVPMVLPAELYQEDRGRKLLVSHHSNSIPMWFDFVSGSTAKIPTIKDDDFGRFFIISTRQKGAAEIMDLRY